jgi:hypothetical protein
MKIYFEDGELRNWCQLPNQLHSLIPLTDFFNIDSSKGYSQNEEMLERIREKKLQCHCLYKSNRSTSDKVLLG